MKCYLDTDYRAALKRMELNDVDDESEDQVMQMLAAQLARAGNEWRNPTGAKARTNRMQSKPWEPPSYVLTRDAVGSKQYVGGAA